MIPAIILIAESGRATAERAAAATNGEVLVCGANGLDPAELLPRLYAERRPIVGVCAAGILIRLLAAGLVDKHAEPPVIAVSQDGRSIVPLLGGHHGANDLARRLAEVLSGHAAITTASESRFAVPLDAPPPGWVLGTVAEAKPAMMALLSGAKIRLEGYAPWLAEAGYPLSVTGAVNVLITEQRLSVDRGLVYHPRTLVAGVGCERGADPQEVIELVEASLAAENLSASSLAALASIDLKADETALRVAARHFGVPLCLFSAAELGQERHRLQNPSAYVEQAVGVPGVAEAAALKAGALLVPKRKSARATCAIGRAAAPVDVEHFGRRPGLLHLVGIGPGAQANRTADAVAALASSTDWVGYGLYLDLVGDLRSGQMEHRFGLGEEELRVRHALELAALGHEVALICSGDPQIFAMAALAFELIEAEGARALSDLARRTDILVHPGISAFQAASATAGALIGHDFCCISLSDLLTPREDIIRRLHAAAEGDFVTAFYNPRSMRRTELIELARDIFSRHRPAHTPVLVASNVGRPDEKSEIVPLEAFDPTRIDMLTMVIFGASTSRTIARGSGQVVAYTPRGYERKAVAPVTADASPPTETTS